MKNIHYLARNVLNIWIKCNNISHNFQNLYGPTYEATRTLLDMHESILHKSTIKILNFKLN